MRNLIGLIQTYLSEAPLADIEVHGEPLDQPGSFSERDRAYMARAILHGVYKKRLANLPFNLYVYVLNYPTLELLGQDFPEGELRWATFRRAERKSSPEAVDVLADLHRFVQSRVAQDPDGIHFIIADNESDETMPPTAWILVHRLVHALTNSTSSNGGVSIGSVRDPFERADLDLRDVLTMASARNKRLLDTEVMEEMVTQYLMTGDIPLDLSRIDADRLDVEQVEARRVAFKAEIDRMLERSRQKIFYI